MDKSNVGNIYDRLFREKAQHIFLPLIEMCLGIEIKQYEALFTGFNLINIQDIKLDEFLQAQVSEVVILALLSKYKKEQIEAVLRSIIVRLQELTDSDKVPSRYINQLFLLARLHKFDESITQIIEDMPITYDIQKDILYQSGLMKGKKHGATQKEIQAIVGFFQIGAAIEQIALT